jgi:hypothetical protein
MGNSATVTIRFAWRTPRLDKALRAAALVAQRFPRFACAVFNLGHRFDVTCGSRVVSSGQVALAHNGSEVPDGES